MVRTTTVRVRLPKPGGFTLIEMLVVLGMIVLLAGIALPSAIGLFRSGGQAQAHNLLSAQLSVARALAVEQNRHIAVHVQRGYYDPAEPDAGLPGSEGFTFAAILSYGELTDPNDPVAGETRFYPVKEHTPVRFPKNIGLGQVSAEFLIQSGSTTSYTNLGDGPAYAPGDADYDKLLDFSSFTFVFGPQGSLVRSPDGEDLRFAITDDAGEPLRLWADPDDENHRGLWDPDAVTDGSPGLSDEQGVQTVTIFDFARLRSLTGARDDYLDANGQFLTVSAHTGLVVHRE